METEYEPTPRISASRPAVRYMALVPVAIVVAALYFGRPVLVPLALATLFAFVLAPLVARLRAVGLNRAISVTIAVVAATLFIGGIAIFVTLQAEGVASELPRYRTNIIEKIETIRGNTLERGLIARTSALLDELRQRVVGSPCDLGARSPSVVAARDGQTPRVQIAP